MGLGKNKNIEPRKSNIKSVKCNIMKPAKSNNIKLANKLIQDYKIVTICDQQIYQYKARII